MATKKPTAAQLAARKLFAARAKAGTLRKKNPTKKKPVKDHTARYPSGYSGKYPGRVKEVHGTGERGAVIVILNDGSKHRVTAADYGYEIPRVGDTFPGYETNPLKGANNRHTPRRLAAPHAKYKYEIYFNGHRVAFASTEENARQIAQLFADKYNKTVEIRVP